MAASRSSATESPATVRDEQRPARYVLCGLSNRAIGMYVPALTGGRFSRSAELVGILDIDQARVRAFLRQRDLDLPVYPAEQFDEMLEQTSPDAVLVTTPDGMHLDYILGALRHDLDAITEKPLVTDCQQAMKVLAAERDSRGRVRVTHNSRYRSPHRRIRQMISEGLVGRITNVELVWNVDTYHGSSYFYRWNRDRAASGGMSITKACHHFDLLNWWLDDRPEQVFAYGALNYYGAASPYNPSVVDGRDYSVEEQRARCPYHTHWHGATCAAPEDDHLRSPDDKVRLPYDVQYPPDRPLYIYDRDIAIEDTYSAVIRYRGGATVTYSSNFSAPWEGYILAVNGTKGRLETTHYTAPARLPFPAPGQQVITYYPLFGERQVHETRAGAGSHGGSDPLLLHDLFVGPTNETEQLHVAARSIDGAYAVAIGEAVWRSAAEQRPITISELLPVDE